MWPEMRSAHNARKEMNVLDTHITVAIDGPSGAGKSTIARAAARRFGLIYVDTGAIYRTVGLACERAGADCSDTAAVQALLTRFGIAREELLFEGAGTSHRVVNTDALNAGRTRPVRYLGPNGERWAGCGRTPAWVIEIESRGGCREHYRVA